MGWVEFKSKMFELGCFNIQQVYACQPEFDRNNFVRWTRKGYLVRLRQGVYAFPEYRGKPGMAEYFAGRIYNPSYISLHSALAFYGIIPESVVQITSVTSLKTAVFRNNFGEYSYKSVRPDLMFGYVAHPIGDGRVTAYASREKALLDLLYLYPFYNNEQEMVELRLNADVLREDMNRDEWESAAARFRSKSLAKRMRLLSKVYGI